MRREAYLTIDDSPCETTDALVDFLAEREIPALFFVSGRYMDGHDAPIVRAIEKGFVIGNHGYAHEPAGDMGFEVWEEDFERCEALINAAYARAGAQRPGLYYRFPYIDRGDGVRVERALAEGGEGDFEENEAPQVFQGYLKGKGFTQPFAGAHPVMGNAADSLFTYTSGDWMLTARHKGRWPCKSLADLKRRIDEDEGLKDERYRPVILVHDQAEIFEEVCALIEYFQQKGFSFVDFANDT